jgi:hypothetical protein
LLFSTALIAQNNKDRFTHPHDTYPENARIPARPFETVPNNYPFLLYPYLNYNISQDSTPQNEPSVKFNAKFPNRVVAAWRDFRTGVNPAIRRVGYSYSSDGGATWSVSALLPIIDASHPRTSDPVVGTDTSGNFYIATISIDNSNANGEILVYKSTDGGVTFPLGYIAQGGSNNEDKEWITCDLTKGTSLYKNTIYCSWTRFGNPSGILLTKSINGGINWTSPVQVSSSSSSGSVQGSCPAVGPNGELYIVYVGGTGSNDIIYFNKSTNGGTSFTGEQIIAQGTSPIIPISSSGVTFPSITVDNSGGPRNGTLYVTWCDARNGDPDIFLISSTNQGVSWSTPVRVNDDAINNGKLQCWPWIAVNEIGNLAILFFDSRNSTSTTIIETWIGRSIDGGQTFINERLSSVPSPTNSPNTDVRYGDYINVDYRGTKIVPVWTDERAGGYNMEIYNAIIDLGPYFTHTPLTNTEQITGPRAVNCQITPAGSGINPARTKLFFGQGANFTDSILMTNTSGTNWTSNITLSGPGTYKYYLITADSLGRIATAPGGAPSNFYSFIAGFDTIPPLITHTPLGPTPKFYWPVSVTANVTDNIGVDSVWVEWYKNTPTTIKEFKLPPVGANNYSALFNSINSDVNIGDVIYYVIKADDISGSHNVARLPVTGYFNFSIINLKLCEGFSGSAFPPYNWTISGTGSSYWSLATVSSYGFGTGSARFNFYSAASGLISDITTFQFDPSPIGDSLKIDIAHAYYGATYIDTLKIDVSTDNGVTFTNLWTLWSSTNFTDPHALSTVSQTGLFTPTSSQWKTRKYLLPTGTNKVRFNAISGFGNDMFLDSICQNSSVTGINNNPKIIPTVYKLNQNYPNPFNPITKIEYEIPKQGFVTLKVFDILGREITRLVNEVHSPGVYSIDFDGTNFSSGIYFYRIEVNGFTDIKKMILIK